MKSMVKFFGIIAIAAVIGFAFAAWDTGGGPAGGPQTYQPVNIAVTGVTLNRTTTTILMGETEQLYAIVAPANATNRNVTWSSSDTAVATVSATAVTKPFCDTVAAAVLLLLHVTPEFVAFTGICL